MTAKTVTMRTNETDSLLLEELGASLRRERLARNMSQADLGAEAGVSRDTVRRMDAGEPVSTLSLVRSLRVLGIADRSVAKPDKIEAATLVATARVLMNLDEFINRE